jgi:hypothetical protein
MQFSALLTLLTLALLSTLVPAAPTGGASGKITDLVERALVAQEEIMAAAEMSTAKETFQQVLRKLKPELEAHTGTLET